MSIEMSCTACGQALRVAEEHTGKLARCPKCGTVVAVPEASPVLPSVTAIETPSAWPGPQAALSPFADQPQPSSDPYAPPTTLLSREPIIVSQLRPHRGGLILALGILSLVFAPLGTLCCFPFGLLCLPVGIRAWVMGAADLRKIRAGNMDPSGRGLTQAGMILGIVATLLTVLAVVFLVVAVVVGKPHF